MKHLKVGEWEEAGKVERRRAEMGQRGSLELAAWSSLPGSAQRREESGGCGHSLQLGGAGRFSEDPAGVGRMSCS